MVCIFCRFPVVSSGFHFSLIFSGFQWFAVGSVYASGFGVRWWARRTAAVCSALSECATRELARQSPLDVLDLSHNPISETLAAQLGRHVVLAI